MALSEKTKKVKAFYTKPIIKSLKKLVKDIEEIPDGDVDRYLIIDEIKKIIKESKN